MLRRTWQDNYTYFFETETVSKLKADTPFQEESSRSPRTVILAFTKSTLQASNKLSDSYPQEGHSKSQKPESTSSYNYRVVKEVNLLLDSEMEV